MHLIYHINKIYFIDSTFEWDSSKPSVNVEREHFPLDLIYLPSSTTSSNRQATESHFQPHSASKSNVD